MKGANPTPLVLCCSLLLLGAAQACQAEIYKYQDDQGRWHFSDHPPSTETGTLETLEGPSPTTATTGDDLVKHLHDAFKPSTAVEEAALAVVAIKTPLGAGSGFFVSSDGYILTNKHVVKPTDTPVWKDLQQTLTEQEEKLRETKNDLARERQRLNDMKTALREYEQAIGVGSKDFARRTAETEYQMLKERYQGHEKTLSAAERKLRTQEREFNRAKSDLSWKSSAATLRSNFKITLKDDTELSARLIAVSTEHDLALLKLDDRQTPYLLAADSEPLGQGMQVLAIGSPLGFKDSMTSGIITRLENDSIVTDATILPGNSGGPLITEKGEVIGVNTIRISQVEGGEGFGVAIPIAAAMKEFGSYLAGGKH